MFLSWFCAQQQCDFQEGNNFLDFLRVFFSSGIDFIMDLSLFQGRKE